MVANLIDIFVLSPALPLKAFTLILLSKENSVESKTSSISFTIELINVWELLLNSFSLLLLNATDEYIE